MPDIEQHSGEPQDFDVDEWFEGDPVDPEESEPRRWAIWLVAAVTVVALALVPLYNLFDRATPPTADNGLEVCGVDYCIVQEGMLARGMDGEMARLATTFMTDEAAAQLAETLVRSLGQEPVGFVMVDDLDGRISGQYDPEGRVIYIERQATAWIVAHEVAHVIHGGHGEDFQDTLAGLVSDLAGP